MEKKFKNMVGTSEWILKSKKNEYRLHLVFHAGLMVDGFLVNETSKESMGHYTSKQCIDLIDSADQAFRIDGNGKMVK